MTVETWNPGLVMGQTSRSGIRTADHQRELAYGRRITLPRLAGSAHRASEGQDGSNDAANGARGFLPRLSGFLARVNQIIFAAHG